MIDVLKLAASMAEWKPRPAASPIDSGRFKRGRGIAAMVYEGDNGHNAAMFGVTVDTKTGKVVVDEVWSAQDCGPALNPDGMRAQAEGCLMQTISRSLIEELRWVRKASPPRTGRATRSSASWRCPSSTSRSSTARTWTSWARARC